VATIDTVADSQDESLEGNSLERHRIKANLRRALFGRQTAPPKIGRFLVIDRLGQGGMGVVFSAYDPQLKREVALKLLQSDEAGSQGRARLLREAQAMASLSHPNVLPVFETGEHSGKVFIVMELVRGTTLREWEDAERRTVSEVIAMYTQAAAGLAAAHAAGIVHRDFKPDNVLVGEDGRARVMDFGLARPIDGGDANEIVRAFDAMQTHADADTPLTQTGTLLGTPAFMAPEQHRGETTDARSDQFSFCASMWQALFGQLPFRANTYPALRKAVLEGPPPQAPSGSRVPGRIVSALQRGLLVDANERHPDMVALAGHLRPPSAARRRWLLSVGVVVCLAAIVALSWPGRRLDRVQSVRDSPCATADEELAELLDPELWARIGARFESASDEPYVVSSFEAGRRRADEWAADWRDQYENVCGRLEQSLGTQQAVPLVQLDCLRLHAKGAAELLHFLETLEPAEITAFARFYDGSQRMPDIARCRNEIWARRRPVYQADPAAAELEQRANVMGPLLGISRELGRGDESLALSAALVADAETVGDDGLLARAQLTRARMLQRSEQGRPEAESLRRSAILLAEASGDDELAAFALLTQAQVSLARNEDAQDLMARANAAVDRAGRTFSLELRLLDVQATAANHAGDAARALEFTEAGLRLVAQRHGATSPDAAARWGLLAQAREHAGDVDGAIVASRRRLALLGAELGPDHPAAMHALDGLGHGLYRAGRYREAVAAYEHLAEVLEPVGNPRLGWALFKLGQQHSALGRPGRARDYWERSERLLARLLGPAHSETLRGPTLSLAWLDFVERRGDVSARLAKLEGWSNGDLDLVVTRAGAAARGGDGEAATKLMEQAASSLASGPNDDQSFARGCWIEVWRAVVARELGDLGTARRHADRALAWMDTHDPAFAWLEAEVRAFAGTLRAVDGDCLAATEPLQAGLEHAGAFSDVTPFWFEPEARLQLALCLENADPPRALAEARKAIEQFSRLGEGFAKDKRRAEEWLADHAS